jgi:hypothetical protein
VSEFEASSTKGCRVEERGSSSIADLSEDFRVYPAAFQRVACIVIRFECSFHDQMLSFVSSPLLEVGFIILFVERRSVFLAFLAPKVDCE